jgi:hypothetical protein
MDKCLVDNHRTGKFGRADITIEAAVVTVSGQITWAGMGSLPNVSTWSTLPAIPYNSPYWTSSTPQQGIIDVNHQVQTLSGASTNSSILTGWLGDDYNYIDYLGFVPRFSQVPTSCSGTANALSSLGQQTPTQWALGDLYDGEMAADFSARYCQLSLGFTGNHELLGISPRLGQSGEI